GAVDHAAAQLGVEGREQAVLGERARAGQSVEEGRLAGVGIAGERDFGRSVAAAPLHLASALDLLEILLEALDAVAQQAAVRLELLFALAAARPFAAALTRQMSPLAGEPGQLVLQA